MSADGRRGFTLVELLVVTVLGALVVLASLQILLTNQRTYTAQNVQIKAQQSLRAAMDVLWGELREVSASGGDLLVMDSDSVKVRAMRKLGVVCATDTTSTGAPYVVTTRVGDWFENDDSVYVFADNDEDTARDDVWLPARVSAVDTTESCASAEAQRLTFAGQLAMFTADSVRIGAPVRSFLTYTYRIVGYSGHSYLGRVASDGRVAALVGPLEGPGAVEFGFRDAHGTTTTVPTDVRQIVVTLRSGTDVVNSVGRLVSDSITTWIYTRN